MMFKTAISMLAGAVLLSTAAVAANDVPDRCPDASLIKSVGFYDVDKMVDKMWFGFKTDTYGTEFVWTFVFGLIEADSADEARLEGSKWLTRLTGNPEPGDFDGMLGCEYDLPGGLAVAILDDGQNARHHFLSFPRK